ncbi:MAG: LysR family transcriptional regulator [Magnetococcus sp. DMHC-6]
MKSDLGNFDLNLLVAFDTLMTERGVTRAGRILGITQAAMSNTLRRLREIFGDPLFIKTGHRMDPTPRAMELAEPVALALKQVRQALDQEIFDPSRSKQVFRIGLVDYAAMVLLPTLLEKLLVLAPGVTVDLVDLGAEGDVHGLENGVVDLVVGRFRMVPNTLRLHRLLDMTYVCVYRKGHPLVGEALTLENFLAARHVHYYPRGLHNTVVDLALSQQGLERRVVSRLFSLSLLPYLVSSSDLFAVLPDRVADLVAKSFPLGISKLPFTTDPLNIGLAWHPRTDKSLANIWLRDRVKEVFDVM